MPSLGDFVATFKANFGEFIAPMKEASKQMKQFQAELRPVTDATKAIGTAMVAAGTATVGALTAMAKQAANYGDAIRDASIRTGATTQSLSALKFIAEQSGTSFEAVSTGLKLLAKNAVAGSEEFKKLGVSVKDTHGVVRPINDIFLDTADKLSKMRDGTAKTAATLSLFGRTGTDLTEILNLGRVGIAGFTAEAEKLGLILGKDAVDQADAFNDSLNEIKNATLGLSVVIGNAIIPALTDLAKKTVDVVVGFRQWAAEYPGLTQATFALGAALGVGGSLVLGLTAVITHLKELRLAIGLLTGPIGLTVAAITALSAAAYYFRNEIASGMLSIGSSLAGMFANLAADAAKLAAAMGLDGLAGRLKEAQFSLEESAKSMKADSASFQEQTGVILQETDAVTKWKEAHRAAMEAAAAATKKFQDAVDAIVKSVTADTDKQKELAAAVKILTAAHVPAIVITDALGKQITDLADALDRQGKAVDPLIDRFDRLTKSEKANRDEMMLRTDAAIAAGILDAQQTVLFNAMEGAVSKLSPALDEAIRNQIKWDDELVTAIARGMDYQMNIQHTTIELEAMIKARKDLLALDTPTSLLPTLPPVTPEGGATSGKETQDKIDAITQGKLKKAMDDIRQSAGHVFDDMLVKGQSVFASLGNAFKGLSLSMGRTLFEDFTAALLGPIKKAFDDFFGSLMKSLEESFIGKLAKSLADKLAASLKNVSGRAAALVAGGAAIGGAVGGTGGAIAGAAAGVAINEALKGDVLGAAIAGVVALGAAISLAFGHGREQADKFISEFQAPFNEAVSQLHDSFFAQAEAGTLTVESAKSARDSLTQMWTQFQKQADGFASLGPNQAKVVKQAMDTITANWGAGLSKIFDGMDSVITTLGGAAEALARSDAIKELKSRVTDSAASFGDMEQALADLIESGQSWTPIVEQLGGDIVTLVHNMQSLGMTVPPYIQAVYDQIQANEALTKSMDRHKEVVAELSDVHQQLVDALVKKLDALDAEIDKGKSAIQGWQDQLKDVNQRLSENGSTLNDAKHWTDMYTAAIKDSGDELQRQTDKRKSLEAQIKSLEIQTQRDKLVAALDAAKGTGATATQSILRTTMSGIDAQGHAWTSLNETMQMSAATTGDIAAAQKALDEFDAAQKKSEMAERVQQLADLKQQLQDTIAAEAAAKTAHELAKLAAVALVKTEKERLQSQLDADFALRDSLVHNILAEQEHIRQLEADKAATLAMFDALHGVRQTELQIMDASINTLLDRAKALDSERIALEKLTGQSDAASDLFSGILDHLDYLRTAVVPAIPSASATPPPGSAGAAFISHGDVAMPSGVASVQPSQASDVRQPNVTSYAIDTVEVHSSATNVTDLIDDINRQVQRGGATLIASRLQGRAPL